MAFKARFFVFEEDRMYTQRESEMLQHYLLTTEVAKP